MYVTTPLEPALCDGSMAYVVVSQPRRALPVSSSQACKMSRRRRSCIVLDMHHHKTLPPSVHPPFTPLNPL